MAAPRGAATSCDEEKLVDMFTNTAGFSQVDFRHLIARVSGVIISKVGRICGACRK